MLAAQNYQRPNRSLHQQQQFQQQQPSYTQQSSTIQPQFYPQTLDFDTKVEPELETENASLSLSSSPHSTQSLISQYPLSAFDTIPTIAVPRGAQTANAVFGDSLSQNPNFDEASLLSAPELMHPESWLHGPLTPKSASRLSHHRESSLSSLGSAGPASPYSHNTSNPQIAVTDSMNDGFHGLPTHDDSFYQLAKTFNHNGIGHDNFYANYPAYAPDSASAAAYTNMLAPHKPKADRGLLPPPDFPIGHNRSRPVSVASSVASDSPATPSMPEPEDERRRQNVFNAVPKLDRTMTDVFNDELYNPNFTITSAPQSQPAQVSVSPNNEMFAQRLHAANNQHLSAAQSPVATTPRDRSPFRHGSPLAPVPNHNFASGNGAAHVRFGSEQQLREQRKAAHDAQALQQQMGHHATDSGTPQTISPKDAMLEFHETDTDTNFPLFPQQDSTGFGADQMHKVPQTSNHFDDLHHGLQMDTASFNNYMQPHMATGVQLGHNFQFVGQPRQQQASVGSMSTPSMSVPSRVSSTESGTADSMGSGSPQKPAGAAADGGTYTCTYHGCTQRFETPALLQKHKREGHRQAHGLNGPRRVDSGMTSTLLNSQAGPHRCDRINPSTGKPCNTVFSRPYDLTRHEDTIHNARKQKVRCNLCTEEKTFSRADALTRHYRVCHPDVEFPGKHRRRANASG
ncbi:Transcriptional regulator RPN4 [Pleurostoma richardsiae]|uniref:Transcriptional regulator RPN4 n=1 Tax=Pleurostoma richardsiae TaxID=41990 RepID=A0AA38VS24_9PEZI|nr:Transcriptional regulator RPN4 [Pleurostoma richardsiae]